MPNDEPLDLGRALEDLVDLGVAEPLLQGVVRERRLGPDEVDERGRRPHRHVAGLQLAHGALAAVHRHAVTTHPRCAPDEQPGRFDLRRDVGEGLLDALLVSSSGPAVVLVALELLERPLVGRLRDAERRAPTNGRVISNVARAPDARPLVSPSGRARASSRASRSRRAGGPPGSGSPRAPALRSARRGCRACPPSCPAKAGRALRDDERRLAAVAEHRIHRRDHDVDVGDAAVRDEHLRPVEDPFVAVALGGRAQRLDVGSGGGLGHRVRAVLDLVARPKHSGTQRAICSGVPDAAMPAAASEEAEMARAMPAQPQWSSSA